MVKYKPEPSYLLTINNWGLSLLALGIHLFEKSVYGLDRFSCGNCKGNISVYPYRKFIPQVCKTCGEEIDWVRTYKGKVRVCPNEYPEQPYYDQNANFCEIHKVALKEIEFWL